MSGFTPLYGSILTSTIWAEDAETRLVWITMLAMADASGYVGASIPGLAHAARVSVPGCDKAIKKFLAPDPYSRTKEYDGKRIEEADGGWRLLNYDRHRERATEIRHNVLSALRMRELRKRRRGVTNVPEQSEPLRDVTTCSTGRGKGKGKGKGKANAKAEAEKKRFSVEERQEGIVTLLRKQGIDETDFERCLQMADLYPANLLLLIQESFQHKDRQSWLMNAIIRNPIPKIIPADYIDSWGVDGLIPDPFPHEDREASKQKITIAKFA
jgi:hypothetical protein